MKDEEKKRIVKLGYRAAKASAERLNACNAVEFAVSSLERDIQGWLDGHEGMKHLFHARRSSGNTDWSAFFEVVNAKGDDDIKEQVAMHFLEGVERFYSEHVGGTAE